MPNPVNAPGAAAAAAAAASAVTSRAASRAASPTRSRGASVQAAGAAAAAAAAQPQITRRASAGSGGLPVLTLAGVEGRVRDLEAELGLRSDSDGSTSFLRINALMEQRVQDEARIQVLEGALETLKEHARILEDQQAFSKIQAVFAARVFYFNRESQGLETTYYTPMTRGEAATSLSKADKVTVDQIVQDLRGDVDFNMTIEGHAVVFGFWRGHDLQTDKTQSEYLADSVATKIIKEFWKYLIARDPAISCQNEDPSTVTVKPLFRRLHLLGLGSKSVQCAREAAVNNRVCFTVTKESIHPVDEFILQYEISALNEKLSELGHIPAKDHELPYHQKKLLVIRARIEAMSEKKRLLLSKTETAEIRKEIAKIEGDIDQFRKTESAVVDAVKAAAAEGAAEGAAAAAAQSPAAAAAQSPPSAAAAAAHPASHREGGKQSLPPTVYW